MVTLTSGATLHYVYDPLCGWCYGAAPLIKAARNLVTVKAYAGGMMAGARKQKVTPQLREFVASHDKEIAQRSGQPFGTAYFDGLLRDNSAVFDSEPPIAAFLAAEQLSGRGLDMVSRLQKAHYEEGQKIADRSVLIEMAASIGLDAVEFDRQLKTIEGAGVASHIRETREFMAKYRLGGFPSAVLETEKGMEVVNLTAFLGNVDSFSEWLRDVVHVRSGGDLEAAPFCGIDGCVP